MNRELPSTEPAACEFEELLARCMGNIDFAERLLATFQRLCESDLMELQQGVDSQNVQHIAGVAHRLKGASANVAAPGLRKRAMEIEDLARSQCIAEIPTRLDQLRDEWARFVHSVSSLDWAASVSSAGSR